MADWMDYLRLHADDSLGDLFELLRIPSISALAEHAADVERAARWVADRLRRAGVEHVQVLPTGGHPVVYGDWLHAEGKPTITFYGHFDVQPTDPVELWTTPPFEPAIRDGRVYARGATDNKGNMLIPILTLDAMLRTSGSLPINVKLFFEGQEEIGSPQLPAFLAAHRDLLASDLIVNTDLGMWGEDQPALLVASKGLCAMQIDVRGAQSDLHSGIYGGGVANPLHALAHILDSMRSADGRILVHGFYEGVAPLSEAERKQIAAIPFDERQTAAELGVPALVAEPGYTPLEHMWARPTLEINGMWGGFQGEGMKTVLPNEAHAKVSCRLVPDQDPADILDALAAHVRAAAPAGVSVSVKRFPATARPYAISPDHPGVQVAYRVLEEVYGTTPVFTRTGGSVPVCELFQDTLGIPTVSFGFGLDDEQLHAPDEFFRLKSFERGQVAYGKLLEALATAPRVR